MRLVQSIEFVTEATIRRVGLFRHELIVKKESCRLFKCDICGELATAYGQNDLRECVCTPCRACGESRINENHLGTEVSPFSGPINPPHNALNMQQWHHRYVVTHPVVTATESRKKPTHQYFPERRTKARKRVPL